MWRWLIAGLVLASSGQGWAGGYTLDDVVAASQRGLPPEAILSMVGSPAGPWAIDANSAVLLLRAGVAPSVISALSSGAFPTSAELTAAREPGPSWVPAAPAGNEVRVVKKDGSVVTGAIVAQTAGELVVLAGGRASIVQRVEVERIEPVVFPAPWAAPVLAQPVAAEVPTPLPETVVGGVPAPGPEVVTSTGTQITTAPAPSTEPPVAIAEATPYYRAATDDDLRGLSGARAGSVTTITSTHARSWKLGRDVVLLGTAGAATGIVLRLAAGPADNGPSTSVLHGGAVTFQILGAGAMISGAQIAHTATRRDGYRSSTLPLVIGWSCMGIGVLGGGGAAAFGAEPEPVNAASVFMGTGAVLGLVQGTVDARNRRHQGPSLSVAPLAVEGGSGIGVAGSW